MAIEKKIQEVKRILNTVDKEIAKFQMLTGLHCIRYCSWCCSTPDIEATITEFLPLAYELYQTKKIKKIYTKLISEPDETLCPLYKPSTPKELEWGCVMYSKRGLVCRLFGFSARLDKNGEKNIISCKLIKEEFPEKYKEAARLINSGKSVPVYSDFYMQLSSVDYYQSENLYPVRIAIKNALEYVMQYFEYRDSEDK